MFLTTSLAKLKEKDASAVDANEVLKMATLGGARAMGLRNCDTLSRGKLADLIVIDLNQPNMQPINNITKTLFTAVQSKTLFSQWLMEIFYTKKANLI